MFVLENKITNSGVEPQLKLVSGTPVAEAFSVSAFAGVSPGYAETYLGPTWHPAKGFSLGLAAGVETAEKPWRVAATATASHDKLFGLGIVEYGGSGLWYKGLATYSVGPVGLGVLAQRFAGVGPRVAVSHKGFELSAAPLYDFESRSPKALVDLSWTP